MREEGRGCFGVWYSYDGQGRASWMVMPGGRYTTNDTVSGTLYRTTGSPWLGASYDPGRLVANAVGSLSFTFRDARATMRYVVDGVEGSMEVSRQPFGNA